MSPYHTNPNGHRKIELAIRRGWKPAMRCGPCRNLRLSRADQAHTRHLLARSRPDNRWRPSPVLKEEDAA